MIKIDTGINSRWWRPPFSNQLKGHNSAIYERICTNFDTENKVCGQFLRTRIQQNPTRITFLTITPPFAHICTEFEREVENGMLQTDLPSKLT